MTDELALPGGSLVALSASELPSTQQQIRDWCRLRIVQLGAELKVRQAQKMHWKRSSWERLIGRTKAKMIYYAKVKAAVEAGYVVIPNFPAEIMAVRVSKPGPGHKTGGYPTQINEAKPELTLPPGQGRYVDEMLPTYDSSYYENQEGKQVLHRRATRTGRFSVPDFPMTLVKPIVLEATHAAMALRVFDRIGLAHGGSNMSKARRRSDPLVVGQILDPADTHRDRRVTFFIAWWLNVRDL